MKMMSIDDSLKKEWIDKAFVLLLKCGLAWAKMVNLWFYFGWFGLHRLGCIMNCVPPHQSRASACQTFLGVES